MKKYQKYQRSGISDLFREANLNIEKMNVKEAWELATEDTKNLLNLTKEDLELVKHVGNMLGKTDVNGQVSELNMSIGFVDSQIEKAEDERKKNEKMCRSLGSIAGLAIIIILF